MLGEPLTTSMPVQLEARLALDYPQDTQKSDDGNDMFEIAQSFFFKTICFAVCHFYLSHITFRRSDARKNNNVAFVFH